MKYPLLCVHALFLLVATGLVSTCTHSERPSTAPSSSQVVLAPALPKVDCKILAATDPNLPDSRTITHLDFQCGSQSIAPPYKLADNNPYFGVQFPLYDHTNAPHTLPENHFEWLEAGHISFYLKELEYETISRALPNGLPARFQGYHFTTAFSACDHEVFNDTLAAVSYYLALHGSKTESAPPEQIHLEGMLQLINHLGEVVYEYHSPDYAFTDLYVDTVHGLLTFRKSGYKNDYLLNGYEVHRLGQDTVLHQLDFDPALLAYRSTHTVRHQTIIPLRNRKKRHSLRKLLLFDPEAGDFLEKAFPPNYDFDFVWADSNYFVLHKSIYRDGIQGQHEFFDTVHISEFTPYKNRVGF